MSQIMKKKYNNTCNYDIVIYIFSVKTLENEALLKLDGCGWGSGVRGLAV